MKTLSFAFAVALATVAMPTRSHAGLVYNDFANCWTLNDGSGGAACAGTMTSFRDLADSAAHAHFFEYYGSGQSGFGFFAYVNNRSWTCTPTPGSVVDQMMRHYATASSGYFSLTWDKNGVCTAASFYIGSDYR
jgi:hypothetical protein